MSERVHGCHAGEFTLPGALAHYPPDLSLEPVHLDIALRINLSEQSVAGTVTSTVRCRTAGARSLRLNAVAFDALEVKDPTGGTIDVTYDGEEIAVTWAEPFALDEERKLAVSYRVRRPATGIYFSKPTPEYPDAPWFAVTDHETERARHWLPSVDFPAVRPRLDFHLRAERSFVVLANGRMVGEESHDDGTKTVHYRLEQRCPSYLTCFVVGSFVRCDDGEHEGVPVSYFAPPPFTADHLRRSFGRTRDMLAWMTRRLGTPYPFPKYFQFAARGIGGAMENISLVSWDDRYVLDEDLHKEIGHLVDNVNVHEMAHTWFGDLVVVRDFAHAWLKESWATYMETCWIEHDRGRDAMLYDLWANAQAYFAEADEKYKRPIVTRKFNSSWSMYDQHLYPGGAWRVHMLRCELGEEVFWAAVHEYLRRYSHQVVETDDLRRVCEDISGRSLGRFFDQWFHRSGYPHLKVRFRHDAEKREGVLEIEQAQVEGEGAESEPFELDLEVAWVIDGTRHVRRLPVRRAKEVFLVPMERDPELIRIDPDGKVLHKLEFNPGDDKLRRQLTDGADLFGRLLAGSELAKSGRVQNVEAVRDAFRGEPSWGVRVQWAKALGDAQSEAAIGALADLIGDHDDPWSLPSLLGAAGSYRDPRLKAALEARLDRGLLPRAAAAAYESLGAQREDAPFSRLVEASAEPGMGGFRQSGALGGLARTRRLEALDVLIDRLPYGKCELRARPAAARALGALAATLDRRPRERAIEALVDVLRDPDHVMRIAGADGLAAARASEALEALEAFRATVSAQERSRVDRIIDAIRKSGRRDREKADRELDELREKVRKLDDTLQRLEARLQKS
jgi:aminopeptidase N